MELCLVDRSREVTTALEQAFAPHPEVRVVCGDILELADDTVVSPANSHGLMDGGIDAVYVEIFGEGFQRRVLATIDRLAQGVLPVGAAALVPSGFPRIPFVIVAPTMLLPGPIRPTQVYFAMSAMLRLANRHPEIRRVYCPGLGTGVGKVAPADAAREMESAYAKWRSRQAEGA